MTPEELREWALDGRIMDIAIENVGIYPKAVVGGDQPYKKRTDYMEGWNAAILAVTKNSEDIGDWWKTVPDSNKELIANLLLDRKLTLYFTHDTPELGVFCSDLFYWACADMEEITFDELPALTECLTLTPSHGELLWCCRKRGMRPQKPYYKAFSKEEASLFDACGPERSAPE